MTTTLCAMAKSIAREQETARQRAEFAEFVNSIRLQLGFVPDWVRRRSQEVEYRIANEAGQ